MPFASLLNALGFVILGIAVFACALWLLSRTLPGDLWSRAVQERNLEAAIILAAIAIALGWIVASAVH
jgi:cytochrome bd-type quinol oxidase subunit 1